MGGQSGRRQHPPAHSEGPGPPHARTSRAGKGRSLVDRPNASGFRTRTKGRAPGLLVGRHGRRRRTSETLVVVSPSPAFRRSSLELSSCLDPTGRLLFTARPRSSSKSHEESPDLNRRCTDGRSPSYSATKGMSAEREAVLLTDRVVSNRDGCNRTTAHCSGSRGQGGLQVIDRLPLRHSKPGPIFRSMRTARPEVLPQPWVAFGDASRPL